MTNWDLRYLGLAKYVSDWSKDPSTKVGSIIVRPDKTIAGTGYNGFPRGMPDDEELYANREEKYSRIIHAEMNALLSCTDQHLKGYTCFTWPFMPCDRCIIHFINIGFKRFVFPRPTEDQLTRWGAAFSKTLKYAQETGVEMVELEV